MADQLSLDFEALPPPRPELVELWTPDDILAAAKRDGTEFPARFREDSRVEWKSARYDPKDLADYFSMWSNTQPHGGLIVVGVEKDGTLAGCRRCGTDRVSEFERVGPEQCPDARFDIHKVEVRLLDGGTDFLLIFRVFYREDKLVETVRGDAYVRTGDRKRRLSEDEKREIRIGKGQIAYEKEPVNLKYPAEFDDLLIDEFCSNYRSKRGLGTRHTREQILALNHLGKLSSDGTFVPNMACALLFAVDPRAVAPGARLRFMRFEGTEEKSGQQYNVVRDIFVDGPLPSLIQEAEQVMSSQIRNFTRLGSDGKFYTRPEYPNDVWLEAIVNACVHRSYNLKNMTIFVKMFDNRLVVESPGGFPPPVTAQNIYDHHNPRNPHLMDALYYMDYVKCAHEGTNRMRSMMLEANLPAPEFAQKEIGPHQVQVVLRNNIEARKEFVDTGALKIIGQAVYELLSKEEKQVINFIAEKGAINVSDANRLLHRDWHTAKKILESLVTRGVLMRRSKTNKERDSQARYVLRRRSP
jgi:ATP-dependent DNA helicase RecG